MEHIPVVLAEEYVVLVLSLGMHDADAVDAFYGPAVLQEESRRRGLTLAEIEHAAEALLDRLHTVGEAPADSVERLRHSYLLKQTEALLARTRMVQGTSLRFDDEARVLYDAVPPTFSEDHFRDLLQALDATLPGPGAVAPRLDRYRQQFVIPPAKIDTVFRAAIAESRHRASHHLVLPGSEEFVLEYVTGKSWSGYNWYRGGCRSLIQINTEFPIYIDRAVDLASHEGYPGHHVYNALLEAELVRARSWVEFTVYALFSPQSLIAEGTANHGILMAFPHNERIDFERDVLFPLAGLDPARAEEYYRIHAFTQRLSYAGNEAARHYLDGEWTRERAAAWLVEYALMPPERAMQRTRFFDQYRSYVINYNLGQDLVQRHLDLRCGNDSSVARRWEEFRILLTTPQVPSGLAH